MYMHLKSKMSKVFTNSIEFLFNLDQEPLGLLNIIFDFLGHIYYKVLFLISLDIIYYKVHIIFQKGVGNFEMECKTCLSLVRGVVPP